eukprot:COSAG02_NODE_2733_length_8136_cov_35.604454_8_plen_199_part_00
MIPYPECSRARDLLVTIHSYMYWPFPTLEYPRDFHNELHNERITLSSVRLEQLVATTRSKDWQERLLPPPPPWVSCASGGQTIRRLAAARHIRRSESRSRPQSTLCGLTGAQRRQEKKSHAVGGGPLGEWRRLTVCSADPAAPHQSGTSTAIPVHRCVDRELVRGAAPGRPLCAATGCGRCPSARRRRLFTNQFTPAR